MDFLILNSDIYVCLDVSLLWIPISVPQMVSRTNGLESSFSGKNILIWGIIPGKIELERRKDSKSLVCFFFVYTMFFLTKLIILSYPFRMTSKESEQVFMTVNVTKDFI